MRKELLLIISFISGYLYVSWLPFLNSVNLNNIILSFVLNPVKVFAAAIAFFVGVILCGIFIRVTIMNLKKAKKKKESILLELISIVLFIAGFYFLFRIGPLQMTLFLSFAFLYGMMTIEKYKS